MRAILSTTVLIMSFFVVEGCKDERNIVEPPNTEIKYYEIVSIDGKTIEEMKSLATEFPTLIKFSSEDSLKGFVTFNKIGERKITSVCGSPNCFYIKLNDELKPATEIIFAKLNFTNKGLEGEYGFSCPTCDFPGHIFVSRKK